MTNPKQLLDDVSFARRNYEAATARAQQEAPALFKGVREAHDLTQRELAEILDVHWTYLSKIENGHMVPGKPTLERLEAYLKQAGDYVE
jgi:DNA-binding XRE family transcriptional regulator